jgi:hypothetical protein
MYVYYELETVPNKNVYYKTKINTCGFLVRIAHPPFWLISAQNGALRDPPPPIAALLRLCSEKI